MTSGDVQQIMASRAVDSSLLMLKLSEMTLKGASAGRSNPSPTRAAHAPCQILDPKPWGKADLPPRSTLHRLPSAESGSFPNHGRSRASQWERVVGTAKNPTLQDDISSAKDAHHGWPAVQLLCYHVRGRRSNCYGQPHVEPTLEQLAPPMNPSATTLNDALEGTFDSHTMPIFQ